MPILPNPRHERFAQELATGKSASEAYELAGYRANRGNAVSLKQQERISSRVAEILAGREQMHAQATARAVERVSLTKEWVLGRLIENAERALQAVPVTDRDGRETGEFQYQGNVANKALELLGKELGMFIDRKEVKRVDEFERMNADELRAYIHREAEALGIGAIPAPHVNGSGKSH